MFLLSVSSNGSILSMIMSCFLAVGNVCKGSMGKILHEGDLGAFSREWNSWGL